MVPSVEFCQQIIERLVKLIAVLAELDIHHDLHLVIGRVRREERLRRALEGGCAFRVLQSATRLRERGHDAADEAYRVARELAPYELLPSPTWEVMCSEMEWPV